MSNDNADDDRREEITSNEKEFTSCEQSNTDAMVFKFEAPPTNSSSGLTFKPSTPSGDVFKFGQSSHPSNNKNDSVNDNKTNDENFNSMAILDNMSTCASCGKEGNSDDMNTCNKCKSVKYCNAACKKKHRKKHKKACERRVAELHDEALFKEIEPEDCPICMLPMPLETNTSVFKSCCGKRICLGCIYAIKMTSKGKDLCAFCRTPESRSRSDEEIIDQLKKLMEKGNVEAFNVLAGFYDDRRHGLPQDLQKANELYLKAGELGSAIAYYNLGVSYENGNGMAVDEKKAQHFYELAAMNGDIDARHNLGCIEYEAGNYQRAMKHYKLAARAGFKKSLEIVKKGFMKGLVTKDEYANTLRAFHERQKEMKSDMRDKAALHFAI